MDDIILTGFDGSAKTLPYHQLEQGISQSANGGQGGPALAGAPTERLGDLPQRPHQRLVVDRGEIPAFDQPGTQDCRPIAHLSDKMDVGHRAQGVGQ